MIDTFKDALPSGVIARLACGHMMMHHETSWKYAQWPGINNPGASLAQKVYLRYFNGLDFAGCRASSTAGGGPTAPDDLLLDEQGGCRLGWSAPNLGVDSAWWMIPGIFGTISRSATY